MDEPYVLGYAAKAPKPGTHGSHGWDPASPSMRAIFVVQGPGIPRGARIPAFENVDIYPWLTELLGLQSATVDGQAGRLRAMLMSEARRH